MKGKFLMSIALGIGVSIFSLPLFAHHGASAFDTGKRITVKGTVTEWFWANPHCFLKFDVTSDNGETAHWVAETSNPPDMINLGWSKQSLKPARFASLMQEVARVGAAVGRSLSAPAAV